MKRVNLIRLCPGIYLDVGWGLLSYMFNVYRGVNVTTLIRALEVFAANVAKENNLFNTSPGRPKP